MTRDMFLQSAAIATSISCFCPVECGGFQFVSGHPTSTFFANFHILTPFNLQNKTSKDTATFVFVIY